MNRINVPLGKSDFESVREKKLLYVDKTLFIEELLLKHADADVSLINRPRRFGKTLMLSTLSYFFDISKDSRELFDGLKISQRKEICEKWMNRFPTVFVSFKDVDGLSFDRAYGWLVNIFKVLFHNFDFLLESRKVRKEDKSDFRKINTGKAEVNTLMAGLSLLARMLRDHYGKKVVLLIDEYDVPMAKAAEKGYYREMLAVMKGVLSVLKDNTFLEFSVITGCLRIAKESIFTGLNNVYSNTVTKNAYDEYFGFLEEEVEDIYRTIGIEDRLSLTKEWYDGYHFGDSDIFCPWDVICYINDLYSKETTKPQAYWNNTGDSSIIRTFIVKFRDSVLKSLNALLSDGYIIRKVNEDVTYDYLHSSEDNIWSILLMTGYLTTAKEEDVPVPVPDGMTALMIPNREIRDIFTSSLENWVQSSLEGYDLSVLDNALWNGESDAIAREISSILIATISCFDYKEDFYHAFLAGIFTGLGYAVDSNKETGEGRADVVVHDYIEKRIAIFEVKCPDVKKKTTKDAIEQIERKKYEASFPGFMIISYGITMSKKGCTVEKKRR